MADPRGGAILLGHQAEVFQRASHFLQNSRLVRDLVVAGTVGLATDPLVDLLFNTTYLVKSDEDVPFHQTFLYGAANSISSGARAFGLLSLADAAITIFKLKTPIGVNLRDAAPGIALTVWGALTFTTLKRTIFRKSVAGNRLGRVSLYDRLIDAMTGAVTAALILDQLSINIGMGLQSIFAAGSLGALIFSLASRDLAENIVGGFVVQAWDAFEVGENIRLGDDTEGVVKKIGLVESEILGSDNVVVRIPNKQLSSQRVRNLSRVQVSQVKQMLRFKYADIKLIPAVLNDIKDEIQASCPKLITDGSRPFRAIMTKYEPDHLEVEVNCHFNIPPSTGEYAENREQVLLAIARAVDKNKVEFALPAIHYKTGSESTEVPEMLH